MLLALNFMSAIAAFYQDYYDIYTLVNYVNSIILTLYAIRFGVSRGRE